jgi:hypothetical protein
MLLTTVKDRAAQLVSGLTDKRYAGLGFAPDGQVTLQSAADSAVLPFSRLPPADKSLVLLAVRLAFMERYVANHHLFVILDEKTAGLDEPRQQLVLKFLKVMARSVQVLWVGSGGVPLADHRMQIG